MHGSGDRVTGERQPADHFADAAHSVVARLVDEGRHFLHVPGDQQRSFARLGQPPDDTAVVGVQIDAVAVGPQECADLVE